MPDRDSVPAGQVPVNSKVRLRSAGTVTSVGATVAVQGDEGLIVLDPTVLVTVVDQPLPITVGSVIRASVNGGAEETLVLAVGAGGNQRWFSTTTRGFVSPSDSITGVKIVFTAPAIPTAR